MSFFNFFKRFTGSNYTQDVSTAFDHSKSDISAEHAYQKSRFGCLKSDTELLNEFFSDVRLMIENKNLHGKFYGIIEVNPDILQFMPKIIDKLNKDLGYKVIVLDDNAEILHTDTNKKSTMNTGSTFIILIWNKEALADVANMNATISTVDTVVNNSANIDKMYNHCENDL